MLKRNHLELLTTSGETEQKEELEISAREIKTKTTVSLSQLSRTVEGYCVP